MPRIKVIPPIAEPETPAAAERKAIGIDVRLLVPAGMPLVDLVGALRAFGEAVHADVSFRCLSKRRLEIDISGRQS